MCSWVFQVHVYNLQKLQIKIKTEYLYPSESVRGEVLITQCVLTRHAYTYYVVNKTFILKPMECTSI